MIDRVGTNLPTPEVRTSKVARTQPSKAADAVGTLNPDTVTISPEAQEALAAREDAQDRSESGLRDSSAEAEQLLRPEEADEGRRPESEADEDTEGLEAQAEEVDELAADEEAEDINIFGDEEEEEPDIFGRDEDEAQNIFAREDPPVDIFATKGEPLPFERAEEEEEALNLFASSSEEEPVESQMASAGENYVVGIVAEEEQAPFGFSTLPDGVGVDRGENASVHVEGADPEDQAIGAEQDAWRRGAQPGPYEADGEVRGPLGSSGTTARIISAFLRGQSYDGHQGGALVEDQA